MLRNKKILVTGISNDKSIAYGISEILYREGAQLAFSYQNDKLRSRVEKLAQRFHSDVIFSCDVSKDEDIDLLFFNLSKKWEKIDGFVHSIAFAPKEELRGNYVDSVTRKGFTIAHEISSYSFLAMAKSGKFMLNPNSSLVTLTYLGSERVIPNYNVMGLAKASLEANVRYMAYSLGLEGIRVNAISSGPIRTLAASGIKDFRKMLSRFSRNSLIRRKITLEDIGNASAFLLSDLSSGITGEVIYVDGGANIACMMGEDSETIDHR